MKFSKKKQKAEKASLFILKSKEWKRDYRHILLEKNRTGKDLIYCFLF
jgi:hypothetical protein